MELVALLSSGKGTWGQVAGLMKQGEWERIIIIGDAFSKNFTSEKKFEFVQVDFTKGLKELQKDLLEKLKEKFSGLEVALSIASGSGKEHMALISSLINIPVGIKFVALTKDGIIYF